MLLLCVLSLKFSVSATFQRIPIQTNPKVRCLTATCG